MIQCQDCVAYRHLLKDILRGDPKDAPLVAMRGLNDDQVSPLGKVMHKIVKAAVQLRLSEHGHDAHLADLRQAVDALLEHPGATVRSWETSKE